jgi:ppGpp synthetase/RelA/SpoT-type nucleotidyltranferase/tetratricopeptide (TPR) repeat protein
MREIWKAGDARSLNWYDFRPGRDSSLVAPNLHRAAQMADDDQELQHQANIAKRGAGYVVTKLQHLMNEGAPSIADLAYTLRLREKEDYKIIEKVRLKREEKDPTYSVSKIRDIVGLRIVTLYRVDALEIIPRLIGLVRANAGATSSLFETQDLEEIKIYSTNPKGDAQVLPQRLVKLFQSLGYANPEIVGTPSSYTSIHLVTWCHGKYKDAFVRVPIEIQIRTALEDAWGEIDHKLKYKPPAQKLTVREEIELKTCHAHLNVMKAFIDGAAQYADQIRVQSDQVTGQRFVTTRHRVVQDTRSAIRAMNLSGHIRTQIEHALDHQTEAMHSLRRHAQYAQARIGSLRNAVREFGAASELVTAEMNADDHDTKTLVRFLLPMEIALCHFQLGTELKDKSLFADAVKLYQAVQDEFPGRAVVHYRYARTLQKLGDLPAAIGLLEGARSLLDGGHDTSIGANHWLRLTVVRILGVCMWEMAEAVKNDPSQVADGSAKIRDLYLEAYRVTKSAYTMNADPDPLADKFDLETEYKGRIANNLIYYVEELLALGGAMDKLRSYGYEDGHEDSYVRFLEEHSDHIDSPHTVHTLLRHYLRKKDATKANVAAVKLIQLLRLRGLTEAGGNSFEDQMMRDALAALEGQSNA